MAIDSRFGDPAPAGSPSAVHEGPELADCVVALDPEGRHAVHRFWSGVVREAARESAAGPVLTSAVLDGSAAERRRRRELARRLAARAGASPGRVGVVPAGPEAA
jgi:hypothetical protein